MAGKGQPKTGGRPPGQPNRMTREVKDMILAALDKAGGVAYLARQAEKNPGPFMALVGKVLPHQVTGADGGAVKVDRVERVIIDYRAKDDGDGDREEGEGSGEG